MKVTEDKILAVFRLQVSGKEACITITRVSKCYKLTRVKATQAISQLMET